jgi:hypothetical protein
MPAGEAYALHAVLFNVSCNFILKQEMTMRSKLYDNFGGYKVWERPLNKGKGHRFEVRQGNHVLSHHIYLHLAQADAKARMNAWWDEQERVLKEMTKK